MAYYPGCSQKASSLEYDLSTRAVCAALGIDLVELADWTCCGASPAHAVSPVLAAALSARNLYLARAMGHAVVATPCPSCLQNLRHAEAAMTKPESAKAVNALLDTPYPGGVASRSILQIIVEDLGFEAVAEKVVRPLSGLRLAPYYGCLTTRPAGLMAFDNEENPVSMDRLMAACGAEIVEFPLKTECCGASLAVPRRAAVTSLSGRILDLARERGAEAVVVACPLCQLNLDLRRPQIEAANQTLYGLPVFYFTQLLGLALGLPADSLGLDRLCVPPGPALARAAANGPEAAPCA